MKSFVIDRLQETTHAHASFWAQGVHAVTSTGELIPLLVTSAAFGEGHRLDAELLTKKERRIVSYRWVFRLGFPPGLEPQIHHHALPRMHRRMTLPISQRFGEQTLPRTTFTSPENFDLSCGHQDMLLHPACVVFQEGGLGWLVGPLTQLASFAGYDWNATSPLSLDLTIEFHPLGLEAWKLQAGERFRAESLFVETLESGDFGPHVFEAYHDALQSMGLRGRATRGPVARHELFWGTWNEGGYRNVSETLVLREASWIRAHLPNVKWIQIDDGYQADADPENPGAKFGLADLGAHAEPELLLCRRRFPRGMRALTEDLRAMGLHPMIWFSPACVTSRKLYLERPDLFVPDARLHFVPSLAFPDFSKQEIRDLVLQALDRLFIQWGFEGVKLDFWTYQFLQERLHLSGHDKTNLEWMRWLELEIRKRVGPNGLMLSCLDPANGDPFRSDCWDMHRIGPDIDGLTIEVFEEVAIWVASLTALKGSHRRFWVPDGDGLSLFRHADLSDSHWRLITTLLVASGACTELAGKLSQLEEDSRMPAFLRAVEMIRHGQPVECPGYNWSENLGRAPSLWWRRDFVGGGMFGAINWDAAPASFRLPDELFGSSAVDIFTGKSEVLGQEISLPAKDARLWKIA